MMKTTVTVMEIDGILIMMMIELTCGRGPHSMLPLLRDARKVCKVSDDDDDDDDDDGYGTGF